MQLSFVKIQKGNGSRMLGRLEWGHFKYEVITGGYGRGAIPDGLYEIEVYRAAEGNRQTMQPGFVNPTTGQGWFLPLKPQFNTSRYGFGIHPDGNLPGTMGCLGLQGDDIQKFWSKWKVTPMEYRPRFLLVTTSLVEN